MVKYLKRTPARERKFLHALKVGATVSLSAERAGVSTSTVYNWRTADPEFHKAWDLAVEAGTDRLEDEAFRRALEGVAKPIFYQGKQVAYVRDYSDSLLVLMLKARRPEKFKERAAEPKDSKVDVHGARDTLIGKLVPETPAKPQG